MAADSLGSSGSLGSCGTVVRNGSFGTLIERVSVTSHRVHLGESFRVTVETHERRLGRPIVVSINGTIGDRQFMQFADYAGARKIRVVAYIDDDTTETRDVDIEVLPSVSTSFPVIDIAQSRACDYGIRCSIANVEALALDARAQFEWSTGAESFRSRGATVEIPLVGKLDAHRLYQTFDVQVTVHLPDERRVVARRSVTLWNDYAAAKLERNVVQPPLAYDFLVSSDGADLRASCLVHNVEDVALVLNRRQIEVLQDESKNDSKFESNLRAVEPIREVVIPPRSVTRIDCGITREQCPPDAFGFAVHFQGLSAAGHRVHVSAYFEVAGRAAAVTAVPSRVAGALRSLRVADEGKRSWFTSDEVQEYLLRDDHVEGDRSMASSTTLRSESVAATLRSSRESKPVRVATRAALSSHPRDLLRDVSRLHAETREPFSGPDTASLSSTSEGGAGASHHGEEGGRWVFVPARILNARKGDTILCSSGASSFVGPKLHLTGAGSSYTHCGIMIRDFAKMRHACSSLDRVQGSLAPRANRANADGANREGIDAEKLEYLWPGTVTQSAEEAVEGGWLPDPDGLRGDDGTLKMYRISAIGSDSRANGNNLLVSPLVVKPSADAETTFPAVRRVLHRVAEAAKEIDAHYRLYGFRDFSRSLDPSRRAPNRPGWWASETVPTTCSGLIRTAMQMARDGLRSIGDDAKDAIRCRLQNVERAAGPADILLWSAPRMDGDRLLGLYGFSERMVYRPARFEWLAGRQE